MSYLGGIGRGRGPVPPAQNAQNRELQKPATSGSIIRSAKWGRTQAKLNETVPVHVFLSKSPLNPNAVVEVYFNTPGAQPELVEGPIAIRINGMTGIGNWHTKNSKAKDLSKGVFTFRVTVDRQSATSDALTLMSDAMARMLNRINTDGFDR